MEHRPAGAAGAVRGRRIGFTADDSGKAAGIREFAGTLDIDQPVSFELADALAAARAHRPELQPLAKLPEAGAQTVRASRAGYLPEVDLVGNDDVVRNPYSGEWDRRVEGWEAGVPASWLIFDGRADEFVGR